MRYENTKSFILVILVIVSVLLTWSLWTYQPNYEVMQKSNNVAEVTLSEKQEVQKIIKPDIVLYHLNGEHFGTTNSNDVDKLIKEISRWDFHSVKNVTSTVTNLNELLYKSGNTEIAFPAEVPVELYRNVLTFPDKEMPPFNFDRIIIGKRNHENGYGTVYFVSANGQQVYSSHISTTFLDNFNSDFVNGASRYPKYFAYKPTDKRTLFLPNDKIEMMEYKYLPVTLNSEAFKDALFNDPSFVQKSIVQNGEEYTNASSKMSINNDGSMLLYVKPTASTDYVENSVDLVKRSIDFVNEHGGWTDPYRYVEKDVNSHKVTFRLYSADGHPVFNDIGMSEINEFWGQNDINKYVRPSMSLELPLKSEMHKVSVPTASEALEVLKGNKSFKIEHLEELLLGYRMDRDPKEPRLMLLEPAWFYRYNNVWGMINMEDLGGMKHGLE